MSRRELYVPDEMREWIAAHGSERLKLCVEQQIECTAIYRDEWVAKERPGFSVKFDVLLPPELLGRTLNVHSDTAKNPPLEAVRALAALRTKIPEAALVFVSTYDRHNTRVWAGYALSVPTPWGRVWARAGA